MFKFKAALLAFLLHLFVISLIITIGVLFLLPNYFSKYQLVEDFDYYLLGDDNKIYYEDIDNDGLSEKFILLSNTADNNKASYVFYKSNGDMVDQFNLNTYFGYAKNIWFQDTNNNGIKEMYLLTKSEDSIFLNSIEHLNLKKPISKKIFVDHMHPYKGDYELRGGIPGKMYGLDYSNDIVYFNINAGYGGAPRNVYCYNPKNNAIIKSPHITNSGGPQIIIDIDQDGKNEILMSTYATGNTIDTVFTKRSDYTTWLTILDDNLQFLFPPIAFDVIGQIRHTTVKYKAKIEIISLFSSSEPDKAPSKLFKINTNGIIEKEVTVPKGYYDPIKTTPQNEIIIYDRSKSILYYYNTELELLNTKHLGLGYTGSNSYYDCNKDGTKEFVSFNTITNKLTVLDENFENQTSIVIPNRLNGFQAIDVRYTKNDSQLYLQLTNGSYIYSYQENPYYAFKYLFYLGVYASVLLLSFLIAKGQKLQDEKKRNLEKQITDLQLKTIKNKVDPHFVFNALNTISEMTLVDDKLEVDRFISRFANFMRTTLAHSDKIATSIKDEMNYTEDFIKLQQIRFNYKFDYTISVSKDIDQSMKIPKHCIFTYVENAIKYGVPAQEKGKLGIRIAQDKQQIIIQIQDNGPGLRKQKNKKKGTGNGLKIMNKIFSLYENRYKTKIEHTITEIKKEEAIQGVLVQIKIATSTKK